MEKGCGGSGCEVSASSNVPPAQVCSRHYGRVREEAKLICGSTFSAAAAMGDGSPAVTIYVSVYHPPRKDKLPFFQTLAFWFVGWFSNRNVICEVLEKGRGGDRRPSSSVCPNQNY